ncbi:DUF7344 domain-containing protein [Natronobacterium texcoconense]|uniref:DUF7344 domain-containing protein n=1 Tax=Natronobacterium texcoconense TaxID=1095778 RepID=A0A1H1GRT5_NATTX|nr:hypothetical protein [Natronobacterium texcoconense]SDR15897.1 hypothetical protein SAMN04489842_2571 [Natronobacterium texcoconense]
MVGPQCEHDAANATFDVLAHHRRRYVLQCLHEFENPIPISELADEVAVREYETSLAEISAERLDRVGISLHHVHVPKLVEEGYVRYDREQSQVTLEEPAVQLEQLRAYIRYNRAVML